jgi:hypothetical protein
LIDTFSRRLAEVTLNALRGGAQCLYIGLGGNRVNERLNDHAQQVITHVPTFSGGMAYQAAAIFY